VLFRSIFRAGSVGFPLLRSQGAILLEGHAFFSERKEAEQELHAITSEVRKFLQSIAVPTLLSERTRLGNLPVSSMTIGLDSLLPWGRTLQAFSSYMQGTLYSDLIGIKIRVGDDLRSVHVVEWGFSERVVGIMLAINCDNKGIVIPPVLAPTQVQLFVIHPRDSRLLKTAENIRSALSSSGIRCSIDAQEEDFVKRIRSWERHGIPIRIDIGEREITEGRCKLRARIDERVWDSGVDEICDKVPEILRVIEQEMMMNARARLDSAVKPVTSVAEAGRNIHDGKVISLFWCGKEDCQRTIESEVPGEILGKSRDLFDSGNCLACGDQGHPAYACRRF